MLIVGTRGRSLGGVQGLLPGSVSKWCLQSSPIPVIVVRPETKKLKKRKKLAAPTRAKYNTILEQNYGSRTVFDSTQQNSVIGALPSATDDEAAAVAKAIGVPKDFQKPARHGSILKRTGSRKSEVSDGGSDAESETDTSPDETSAGFLPVGYMRTLAPVQVDLAMKSPTWQALEEDDDDDEDASQAHDESKLSATTISEDGEESQQRKEHSASFSEDPPWLKKILSKPENSGRRRSSAGGRRAPSPYH